MDHHHHHELPEKLTWRDFIPLKVVMLFVLGGTIVLSYMIPEADWIRRIMFFEGLMLTFFSLFKLMNIPAFQEGYRSYDLIASRLPVWGYLYPFAELKLGVLLLLNVYTQQASAMITILSVIGLIGVAIEMRKDRKIRCACLGTALNVPLTTVTLYENLIMLVLALSMLFAR